MLFTCLMSKEKRLAVDDGTMDKEQTNSFLPSLVFHLQVSQREERRCETEWEDGVLESHVPALRAGSQEDAGQPLMPGFLEVIQKLPGPANLFLSQIISLAKILTRNFTLTWGQNGCHRWLVWGGVDASACPFPFLREAAFVVLAAIMDQGCLFHFTKIQSPHRLTCSFLMVALCCTLCYCGGLTEKCLPSLMYLNTWFPSGGDV